MEGNASSSPEDADSFPPSYLTVRVLISLGSVMGNSLVIYLVISVQRLHTPPNWFVLSLAVADFSVGFFLTPIDIFLAYYPSPQSYTVTTLDVVYDYILDVAALGACALIYDRYLAITKPLRYHTFMTKRRVTVLVLPWLLPAVLGLPIVFLFQDDELFEEQLIYKTVLVCLFQFLPSVLMVLSYAHILFIVRRHSRQTAIQMTQLAYNLQPQNVALEPRVVVNHMTARLVGALVVLFVSCYVISVYKAICFAFDLLHIPPAVDKISLCMIHFNSFANCGVYALLKKDIRNELKALF